MRRPEMNTNSRVSDGCALVVPLDPRCLQGRVPGHWTPVLSRAEFVYLSIIRVPQIAFALRPDREGE